MLHCNVLGRMELLTVAFWVRRLQLYIIYACCLLCNGNKDNFVLVKCQLFLSKLALFIASRIDSKLL